MTRRHRRQALWVLALVAFHEGCGYLLAWSDWVGGAFSPGPHALLGILLALLFVSARLLLWLVVVPAAAGGAVLLLWGVVARGRGAGSGGTERAPRARRGGAGEPRPTGRAASLGGS